MRAIDTVRRRLASIDFENPRIDPARAERALAEHFRCIALAPVQFLWMARPSLAGWRSFSLQRNRSYEQRIRFLASRWSAPQGVDPVRRLVGIDEQAFSSDLRGHTGRIRRAGMGNRRLARSSHLATRIAVAGAERRDDLRSRRALVALADAACAGLFAYWVRDGFALLVPRPRMLLEEGRLHAWDGRAALKWADGECSYFWRGVEVGQRVGSNPGGPRLSDIRLRRNAETRRVLIERYGWERYLRDSRAQCAAADARGTLWRFLSNSRDPAVILEVENSTPEPDGSRKRYFLRVPPELRTPTEAVAWTFGFDSADEYAPASES